MAVPASLQRLFEETITISNSFNELANCDKTKHRSGAVIEDLFGLDSEKFKKTSLYAVMGDDGARGKIELKDTSQLEEKVPFYNVTNKANVTHGEDKQLINCWDSSTVIHWPGVSDHPLFYQQVHKLFELVNNSSIGGKILVNPLWNLVPDSMSDYLYDKKGMIFTVHPLGGCPMGNDGISGVVNHLGQVFDLTGSKPLNERSEIENKHLTTYESLVVLDGSIIPRAICTNPALTIASISLRAIKQLKGKWKFYYPDNPKKKCSDTHRTETPYEFSNDSDIAEQITPTEILVLERMEETLKLKIDGEKKDYYVRLTTKFKPKNINKLIYNNEQDRVLEIDEGFDKNGHPFSKFQIFNSAVYKESKQKTSREKSEEFLCKGLIYEAPISGQLSLFTRKKTNKHFRIAKSLYAWLLNRGLRDTWQFLFPKKYEKRHFTRRSKKQLKNIK